MAVEKFCVYTLTLINTHFFFLSFPFYSLLNDS